jgi:hypothetical protein
MAPYVWWTGCTYGYTTATESFLDIFQPIRVRRPNVLVLSVVRSTIILRRTIPYCNVRYSTMVWKIWRSQYVRAVAEWRYLRISFKNNKNLWLFPNINLTNSNRRTSDLTSTNSVCEIKQYPRRYYASKTCLGIQTYDIQSIITQNPGCYRMSTAHIPIHGNVIHLFT